MKINIRIKGLFVLLIGLLGIFSLMGCQLARADAGKETSEYKLIGVLVTHEYLDLFDFEGYLKDNIGSVSGSEIQIKGNSDKYGGRLYAELKERELTNEDTGEKTTTEEYVFENIEGIPYFAATIPSIDGRESYVTTGSDDAITDRHVGLFYGDDEDKITLEGTIYISSLQDGIAHYINPVYQDAHGRVFALTGDGIMMNSVEGEGSGFSQNLEETSTSTENGKSKEVSTSVTISIDVILPPEKIVILEMDENSSILGNREYSPGELPDKLTPKREVDYIIVETHKRDSTGTVLVTRELFSREDETLSTFYCRKDGICVKAWTQLTW